MNMSDQKFKPKMGTLTIGGSESLESVEWNDDQRQNVIAIDEVTKIDDASEGADAKITKMSSPAAIIGAELAILAIFSGIEAEEKQIAILNGDKDSESDYSGNEFRAPEKREYRKLLWTDSLWPCGGFSFHFDIISQARPNDKNKVPDGYYVPKIKFIPVSKWAIPGCKLTADMIVYEPKWSTISDGLKRAEILLDVDVHLIKLGVFNWKSRIKYSLFSDSAEVKLLSDPLPTPF